MKAPIVLISFFSSFAALAALPWSIELAVSPVVITGLVALLRADYGSRRASLAQVANDRAKSERLPFAA